MPVQAGADLHRADDQSLLDRNLTDLQEICRVPCLNRICQERKKFKGVTDNARVSCLIRCYQNDKDVTNDDDWLNKSGRELFVQNMQRMEAEDEYVPVRIGILCKTCSWENKRVEAMDTVEKLFHELRECLAHDKKQPLLYNPRTHNPDLPDDARFVCDLAHCKAMNDFVREELRACNLEAIEASLDEGALSQKLIQKGIVAGSKFGDRQMTYIRIGLGLKDLGKITAVLELWPKGFRSPKHHHGGCAGSVRVVHGKLCCKLFASLLDEEPLTFSDKDGRLGLGPGTHEVLTLQKDDNGDQTTWLNRQNWFVHQVYCDDSDKFAMSIHIYKSCTDAFAFVNENATGSRSVQGPRVAVIEKGNPSNDYFWNIDLPETDERVKEIGQKEDKDKNIPAGPLSFREVLDEGTLVKEVNECMKQGRYERIWKLSRSKGQLWARLPPESLKQAKVKASEEALKAALLVEDVEAILELKTSSLWREMGAELKHPAEKVLKDWDVLEEDPLPWTDLSKAYILKGHTGSVTSICRLASDSLATGSEDSTVCVWTVSPDPHTTPYRTHTLKGHTGVITSICRLATHSLATGSSDKTVCVWTFSDPHAAPKCTHTLEGHTKKIWSICRLANHSLATGSDDTTVRVWTFSPDQPTTQDFCAQTLTGHTKSVTSICRLASDSLATGSDDNTVRVWTQSPDHTTPQYSCTHTLENNASIWSICRLASRSLATGSEDDKVRVWTCPDHHTWSCTHTLEGHGHGSFGFRKGSINSICRLASHSLATGSNDNTVHVWAPPSSPV